MLDELFVSMFDGLNERFVREIEVVNKQHPFEPLKYCRPTLRLTFEEGIKMLQEAAPTLIRSKISARRRSVCSVSWSRRNATPTFTCSRGILSTRDRSTRCPRRMIPTTPTPSTFSFEGKKSSPAQQRFTSQASRRRAAACGIEIPTIQPYIDSFKYGAMPHGGCGVGLERVAMLFLDLNNIRKTSMFPRDPKRLAP